MGMPDAIRRSEKKRRFESRHPGAEAMSGRAGTYSYPYIAYHESEAAAWLELGSILSVVFGMGAMMIVSFQKKNGLSAKEVLLWAIGMLLVNRVLAVLACIVNNRQVRSRIVNDTDYAYYFAWKYPAQSDICRDLNAAYAANPDAVPREIFLQKEAAELQKQKPFKKWICILGLGFLFLAAIAFTAFCMWVKHETE